MVSTRHRTVRFRCHGRLAATSALISAAQIHSSAPTVARGRLRDSVQQTADGGSYRSIKDYLDNSSVYIIRTDAHWRTRLTRNVWRSDQ